MPTTGAVTRDLIWIPILHTQADLGSMSESVQQVYIHKMGKGKWDRHQQMIEKMWDKIGQAVNRLNLDYSQVRLYQDGLPNCGHEEAIVRDLARSGSRNHRLLLELMEKGARLTGTESPELLLEEYELARSALVSMGRSRSGSPTRPQQELGKALLERRDAYIADRINKTLEPGVTGQVYLGMLHSLEGRLAPDIHLHRLDVGV
jgi:hypothetical protein